MSRVQSQFGLVVHQRHHDRPLLVIFCAAFPANNVQNTAAAGIHDTQRICVIVIKPPPSTPLSGIDIDGPGDSGRALNLDSKLNTGFELDGAARDEEFLNEFSFNAMLQQNDEEMHVDGIATVLGPLYSCGSGGSDVVDSPTEIELQGLTAEQGLTAGAATRPTSGRDLTHAAVQSMLQQLILMLAFKCH